MNGFNSLRLKKQLSIANRELGSIEKIAADGGITLSLGNGRKIEFNAAVDPHFDHGYAVTSYGAQGLTADRVLINADTTRILSFSMHDLLMSAYRVPDPMPKYAQIIWKGWARDWVLTWVKPPRPTFFLNQ